MSILPFLGICAVGAFLALLAQPFRRLARLIGMAGLIAAFAAALALGPSTQVTVGDVRLQTTWYVGLFLTIGTASCLLLCVLGLASGWPERLAPAALATFGGMGLAISSLDPGVALIAAAAAATPAALVAIDSSGSSPWAAASASLSAVRLDEVRLAELRTVALVVGGATLAAASALLPNWTNDPTPVYALAFIALALAIAVRCGVVPFHVPTARLSTTSARLALPLLLVWIPAGLALIALEWGAGTYGIQSDWLTVAIATVQILGVATLVLGAVGAMLHEELEEIAAYSIVQDAGFIMLALAARDGGTGEPLRMWLLVFIIAKSALMAWVAAMAWMFGSSHLQDLRGWVRRAPVLAVALVAIVVATLGWPGSPVFEARSTLVGLGLPSQLHVLSLAAIALALVYYGRLLAVGLLSPGERVLSAEGERPVLHAPPSLPKPTTKPATDLTLELAASGPGGPKPAVPSGPMASPRAQPQTLTPPPTSAARLRARRQASGPALAGRFRSAAGRAVRGTAVLLWLNRRLEASLVVLMTGALAVAVALGGLGASDAARTGTAVDVAPGQTDMAPSAAAPSSTPSAPQESPAASGSESVSGSPTALPSGSPAATTSASASPQPSQAPGD